MGIDIPNYTNKTTSGMKGQTRQKRRSPLGHQQDKSCLAMGKSSTQREGSNDYIHHSKII